MDKEHDHTIWCEYCEAPFTNRYTAEEDKSRHKARCADRRYLGGSLISEEF